MKANKRKIIKAIAISKIIMEAEMDIMRLWNARLPDRVLVLRYGAAAIEVGKMQATPASVFSAKRPRVGPRRRRRRERKQIIIRTQVEPNTSTDEVVRLINEGIRNDKQGRRVV